MTHAARRRLGFLVCAASVAAAVSAHAGQPPAGFPFDDPALRVQEVVRGLNVPTTMAFIGPADILVLQKNDGKVRRVLSGVLQPDAVLDVAVNNAGERGLLGIAIHPAFPTSPFVYLFFTESATGLDTGSGDPLGNRIYRYEWDGGALINPTLILDLPATPGSDHESGVILFGPDGKLYVMMGDLDRNGQLQNFPSGPAPDDTSVIVRINDDGTIPVDNPLFAQGGNLAKYDAYGIRNGFGLAFDPLTGALWDTENGPTAYDEVNRIDPGFNSGWEQLMGPDARDPQGLADLFQAPGSRYSDPEFSWFDPVAPTAALFLTTTQLGAAYENDLLVADFLNGAVYRFDLTATRDGLVMPTPELADLVADTESERQAVVFGAGLGGLSDLEVGPDGLLYMVSVIDGKILVASPAPSYTVAADLTLQASASPDPVTVGNALTYTITVTNNGPNDASGVMVTDTLPVGMSLLSATPTQGGCSGSSPVTCALGALASGATSTVTIVASTAAIGEFSNTPEVSGTEIDLNTANNDATVTTTVNPVKFRLRVTKTGNGSGTVTSDPGGITCGSDCSQWYVSGTVVSLTPTPAIGSIFAGWSGDVDCSDGLVTVDAGKTCTATFIGPDLVVSSLSAPFVTVAGAMIAVTDTTKNQGSEAAGASTTRIVFSANNTLDAGDTELGGHAVPPLAPGVKYIQGISVTVPAQATTGTYSLIAQADTDLDVDETRETNNTRARTLLIGPDLVVNSLSAPTTAAAGTVMTVTDGTKNQGSEVAGASMTRLYLSTNKTLDAGDIELGSRAVPALNPGVKSVQGIVVTIQAGTSPGTYYLIAQVDAQQAVTEASESNNTKYRTITIP